MQSCWHCDSHLKFDLPAQGGRGRNNVASLLKLARAIHISLKEQAATTLREHYFANAVSFKAACICRLVGSMRTAVGADGLGP